MALSLKHTFNSAKTDGSDATLIQPSAWNSEHTITLDATTIVGNISGSTAAAAALTPAQGRYVLNAASSEAASYLSFCVNPFLEISQENGTTLGSILNTNRYCVDQFVSILPTAGAGTATNQQVADPFSGTANYKRFRNALKITVGTAQASLGATDYLLVGSQRIEGNFWKGLGWGTADAASVDVVAIVSASVTGTYSLPLRNGGGGRSYVVPVSLTANTPTVVFATIPGDTSGTWATDNTLGAELSIVAGCGATYQAPTNSAWQSGNYVAVNGGGTNLMATAGATITIAYLNIFPTGVLPYTSAAQVDLAHLANMRRPYDDELRRCQRYFALTYSNIRYTAAGASNVLESNIIHPVKMRTNPSLTLTAGGRANIGSATAYTTNDVVSRAEYVSTASGDTYALGDTVTLNARM